MLRPCRWSGNGGEATLENAAAFAVVEKVDAEDDDDDDKNDETDDDRDNNPTARRRSFGEEGIFFSLSLSFDLFLSLISHSFE